VWLKIKSPKEVKKTVGIRILFLFLLDNSRMKVGSEKDERRPINMWIQIW
jgi:hypothetical protein